jgi:hypothetical protein
MTDEPGGPFCRSLGFSLSSTSSWHSLMHLNVCPNRKQVIACAASWQAAPYRLSVSILCLFFSSEGIPLAILSQRARVPRKRKQ